MRAMDPSFQATERRSPILGFMRPMRATVFSVLPACDSTARSPNTSAKHQIGAINMMKKLIAVAVVLCVLAPQCALGGAWTLPKNEVWLEQYFKYSYADQDWTNSYGRDRKDRKAKSWGTTAITRVDYGLMDRLTWINFIEYKDQRYKEYSRPVAWGTYDKGAGDWTTYATGLQARFTKNENPLVLSGRLTGFFYLGGENEQPQLSDGSDGVEARFLAGKRFGEFGEGMLKLPFYLGAEVGYRLHNRKLCDQIPIFLEGGFWVFDWLLIKTEIDSFWSVNGTGDIEKDWAIWRIGPTFQFGGDSVTRGKKRNKGVAVNVSLQYGNTILGRNTSDDHELILKVSFQF